METFLLSWNAMEKSHFAGRNNASRSFVASSSGFDSAAFATESHYVGLCLQVPGIAGKIIILVFVIPNPEMGSTANGQSP